MIKKCTKTTRKKLKVLDNDPLYKVKKVLVRAAGRRRHGYVDLLLLLKCHIQGSE